MNRLLAAQIKNESADIFFSSNLEADGVAILQAVRNTSYSPKAFFLTSASR